MFCGKDSIIGSKKSNLLRIWKKGYKSYSGWPISFHIKFNTNKFMIKINHSKSYLWDSLMDKEITDLKCNLRIFALILPIK